jgi:hypothetical protein
MDDLQAEDVLERIEGTIAVQQRAPPPRPARRPRWRRTKSSRPQFPDGCWLPVQRTVEL